MIGIASTKSTKWKERINMMQPIMPASIKTAWYEKDEKHKVISIASIKTKLGSFIAIKIKHY